MIAALKVVGAGLLAPLGAWLAVRAWRDRSQASSLWLAGVSAPARAAPAFMVMTGVSFSCAFAGSALTGRVSTAFSVVAAVVFVLDWVVLASIWSFNRPRRLVPRWGRHQRGAIARRRRRPTREEAVDEHELALVELEEGSWTAVCSCGWQEEARPDEATARLDGQRHCPLVEPEVMRPFASDAS